MGASSSAGVGLHHLASVFMHRAKPCVRSSIECILLKMLTVYMKILPARDLEYFGLEWEP